MVSEEMVERLIFIIRLVHRWGVGTEYHQRDMFDQWDP